MGSNGHVDELIEASLKDLMKRYPDNNTRLHVRLEEDNGISKLFFYSGKPDYWGLAMEGDESDSEEVIVKKKIGNFLRSATVPGDFKEVELAVKAYADGTQAPVSFSYQPPKHSDEEIKSFLSLLKRGL